MTFKEEAMVAIEQAVDKIIEAKSDMIVDLALVKLEAAIPGQIDNMVLESQKPIIKSAVKAELLKLADKISPLV